MKKHLFTLSVLLLGIVSTSSVRAQEVWSLQRCIGFALDQNLTIKQGQATLKTAELTQSQAKAARLPNVGFNSNVGEQIGTTIDPSTNGFVNKAITTNSLNLNASVPLYNGGQINQTINQAKIDAKASAADLEQTTNSLALQVASAYLTVLLNQEQLQNTKNQVELSRKQLINTQKLIDAGNLPLVDRYNVEAQIAREEQNVVTAESNLDLSFLSLKQLMQMEPDFPLQLESPDVSTDNLDALTTMTLSGVYETAKSTQPSIRASELRVNSAEVGIKVARAGYLPSVNLFGNMSAFYSSQNQNYSIDPSKPLITGPTQLYSIAGSTPTPVNEIYPAFSASNIGYFKQLDNTFGQSVGLQVNVPIYQNGRVRLAVERAKLSVLNAQIQNNQVQQQLKNDIQTALANARNAKKQLEASQKTYEATQLAFTNTEKRHAIGAVNSLELNTSKTNFDNAVNNRTVARYNYVFRAKILEFYMGKPLLMEKK
jgi:outer membrane protein